MASKQSFGLKCGEGITIVVPYVKAVTLPEKRRFQKGVGTLKVLPSPGLILNLKTKDLCPKNLTFPKAEREQRCPRLVVVIFCLFISI